MLPTDPSSAEKVEREGIPLLCRQWCRTTTEICALHQWKNQVSHGCQKLLQILIIWIFNANVSIDEKEWSNMNSTLSHIRAKYLLLMMFHHNCGLDMNHLTSEVKQQLNDVFHHRKGVTVMSQHPNNTALFPKCYLCVEKRHRWLMESSGTAERRGETRSWVLSVFGEFSYCAPPSPVACWGGWLVRGTNYTPGPCLIPLIAWPSDPQVNEPTAVCWWLWLIVQMSPLTHGAGLGNYRESSYFSAAMQ